MAHKQNAHSLEAAATERSSLPLSRVEEERRTMPGGFIPWIRARIPGRNRISALAKEAAGIALLLAGVAGIFLPVVPGIPLIIAGVAIIGCNHPIVRPFKRMLDRVRSKEPDRTDPSGSPAATGRASD